MINFTYASDAARKAVIDAGWCLDDVVGIVPAFFSEADDRSAKDQLHDNYAHGGGFHPLHGWKHRASDDAIQYAPEDGWLRPVACARLRNERLVFYEGAWLAIFQPDGNFAVTRVD